MPDPEPSADPSAPASPGTGTGPGGAAPAPSGPARTVRRPPSSLQDAVGGPLGIAESALPAALFVGVYTVGGNDTTVSAIVAVAVAAVLAAARVVRGQTVQFALSGLVGIALAGFIVSRTGKAEDFFLPGLLFNVAYASAYLVSIVVRWPLVGVLVALMTQQDSSWRRDPVALRAHTRASWLWVGLFLFRLAVQLPLYLAGALVALGAARVAMGIPLFVLGLWLTWLLIRDVVHDTDDEATGEDVADGTTDGDPAVGADDR
ncbi:MAG: DUF3159 domain-containing protein [Solirubrobacteraceae bacterium]